MPLILQPIDEHLFDDLKENWNRLLEQSVSDTVFLRWEWIHTWWRVFKKDRALFILEARRDGRLVGIAPFYLESRSPFGLKCLRLCSDDLAPDYLDIFSLPGEETVMAREVVRYLQGPAARRWDIMQLESLRKDSLLLSPAFLQNQSSSTVKPLEGCPYIALTSSFEDYYKAQTPLHRFSLDKKSRKLLNELHVTYQRIEREDALADRLDQMFQLHEKRAAERHLQSNFVSTDVKRFHQLLAPLFLREGFLSLQFLDAGPVPICAHYYFKYRNKMHFYQSGFDPLWNKYSISMVLLYLAVQRAFEAGLTEFDFLKGEEGYKKLWMNGRRDEMRLTLCNRTLKAFSWSAAADVKSILKAARDVLRRPPETTALV
jgi:CelD/BcsL family acetyltransferase involved in cellulose biosynthesis